MAAILNALSLAFDKSGIGSMTISIWTALAWVPGGGGSNMVVNWMQTELSNACQLVARAKHRGVVGWWRCVWGRNTMSDRRQKGHIGGGYFLLLQAPFSAARQKSIVPMHRLDVVLRRVRHRHHICRCLSSSDEDVSVMRRWCIVH